jgi:hypothetical protein
METKDLENGIRMAMARSFVEKAALKTAAHKRVDDLIDAVIDAFGLELERAMKSGYSRFLAE